ncbi:MAG: hypothetical protein WCH60_17255, partial [Burkholderiales bacterium]
ERSIHNADVGGSNPPITTIFWSLAVSRTLKTRFGPGYGGFFFFHQTSRRTMTSQHFVGIRVGTSRKTSKQGVQIPSTRRAMWHSTQLS